MNSHHVWRKCSFCGATLDASDERDEAVETASATNRRWVDGALCAMCRILRSLQRDLPPTDECPRCRATKVLRTSSRASEEVLVCGHCDHIWSRVQP